MASVNTEKVILASKNNAPMNVHTLSDNGFEVKVLELGATVAAIVLPLKNKVIDVALGFDDVTEYTTNKNPCYGAVPGRVANRIAKGKFSLNGKDYSLETNNGPNHLHGGSTGFHTQVWTTKSAKVNDSGNASVCLSYVSKDGEAGYPGELTAEVTYTIVNDGGKFVLDISYNAKTTADTILNLTNHSYLNLSGMEAPTCLTHKAYINADSYAEVDSTMIPSGTLKPLSSEPCMDFQTPKLIGQDIKDCVHGGGYDHSYNLNEKCSDMSVAAAVVEYPGNGLKCTLFTDQPAVQFYTMNSVGDNGTLKKLQAQNGKQNLYVDNAAFCLETQNHPDAVNQPNFRSPVLKPNETYTHHTKFQFEQTI